MAQISRPFQIALAAVAVLGLVWAFALHRPSSNSSTASKAAAEREVAAATPKASASKGSAATGGKSGGSGTYHGSAPGVAGLTGAVAKAHGAVTTSQKNAKQLEEKSAQASGSATPSSSSSSATSTPAKTNAPVKTSAPTHTATPAPVHSKAPSLARQHLVEDELAQGRIVALLFWSPKGADDVAVKNAIEQLAKGDHGIAVQLANAKQVASFGTITRGIQVYGTPTLLIIGQHGKTHTLTGLQDAYAIQQTVSEARHP
jgi:hypothetical protein